MKMKMISFVTFAAAFFFAMREHDDEEDGTTKRKSFHYNVPTVPSSVHLNGELLIEVKALICC